MRRNPLLIIAAVAVPPCISMLATAGSNAPRYSAFVYPPLADVMSAYPAAFTVDGDIVGSASPEPFHPQSIAVVTAGSALMALPSDARSFNAAFGASADGLVVGMMGLAPAYWDDGGGNLLMPLPGYFQGIAWDANTSGLIVGAHTNDLIGFDLPVFWPSTASEAVELPVLGNPSGVALAVNDAGQIAGGLSTGGSFQVVRWDDVKSKPTVIGPLEGALGGEGRAINAAGDVAGRNTFPDSVVHALLHLRDENELIDLGTLGGTSGSTYSEARAVNAQREVVGVSSTTGFVAGFLWKDRVLHDLNDLVVTTNEPTMHIVLAVDIDDASRIAAEIILGGSPRGPRRIALLTPCAAADLDCDGAVSAADLGILLGDWGGSGVADIDGSGIVDAGDLAVLLGAWT
jgi:probable HAF family extracellular repeat protein